MSGPSLLMPPSQAGRLSRPDSQILTVREEDSTGGAGSAGGSIDRSGNDSQPQAQQQEYYEREVRACGSSTTSRHMNGGGPVRKLSQKIKQKFRNLTQNRDRDDGAGTGPRGHFGSHADLRGGAGSGSSCALDQREDVDPSRDRGDLDSDVNRAGGAVGGAEGELVKRRSKLKKQLTFSGSSNSGRDYRRERALAGSRTNLPNTVSMRDLQLQQQLEQAIGCDNRRDRRISMVRISFTYYTSTQLYENLFSFRAVRQSFLNKFNRSLFKYILSIWRDLWKFDFINLLIAFDDDYMYTILEFIVQMEIGFGKWDSYTKLHKLGEVRVRNKTLFALQDFQTWRVCWRRVIRTENFHALLSWSG